MNRVFRNYLTLFPFIVAILCSHALANQAAPPYESFENVEFVNNYDGDSITFNIPEAPAIVGKNMVIRLRGIDSPELRKNSCFAERAKALQAKKLVYSLLKDAQVIHLHRIGRGKYFRMIADVEFDGQDLATVLLQKDLAVKYSGGKKETDWCQDSATELSVRHHSRSVLPPKISGVYIWPPPPTQKKEHYESEQ